MNLKGRSISSIEDLSKEDFENLFLFADKLSDNPKDALELCKGKILGVLFFEPSTRTRLSFESAMLRLGGKTIGFSDGENTSTKKGEIISDTIKTIENYCDIVVMRHWIEGAAKMASELSSVPIINGGDGKHEHPTQTLVDLYTMHREFGDISKLEVCLVGDLKYGRTAHSLAHGLSLFGSKIKLFSPKELSFPDELKGMLKNRFNGNFEEKASLDECLDTDIIYMTRLQKERFANLYEYEKVKNVVVLNYDKIKNRKAKIMHPLPRVNELDYDIDDSEKALYFKQMKYSVPIRMALIASMLGVDL